MHQLVEKFLADKKAEYANKKAEFRKETLLDLGLYEKEYSPDNTFSSDYPYSEWDNESASSKYFNKIPVEVTDEEYAEITKYSSNAYKEYANANNPVATVLIAIACIIYLGGFIAGIALGTVEVTKGYYYTYTDTEFSFAIALTYWFVTLVSGTVLLGFAEIIKLLETIKRK